MPVGAEMPDNAQPIPASPPERPSVGATAPIFSLPSLSGTMVDLAAYRGRSNVVVWFSRGFTCPFCRVYTDGVRAGYDALRAADTEVIQVAPNLLESARRYFGESILPFPFVCDPDKRLYAVYGLGDLRALEATRTAVVSFAHAFTHGDSVNQIRGAWFDVMNRNFLRRLHHHAMTAQEPRRRARSPAPALDSPSPRASSRRTEGGSASRASRAPTPRSSSSCRSSRLTRTPITRGRTPRTSRSASAP